MTKKKKPDPLLASLSNLKPRSDVSGGETARPATAPAGRVDQPPAEPEGVPADKLAPSFSVSVYESDFDRMERVRRWLTSHGARSANKSELLRLGIRFAAQSEENAAKLAEIFLEMKSQDGRRKAI